MALNLAHESTDRSGLRLPNPPPLLHTRSGNDSLDRPSTPVGHAFTSPVQTPQGSPSKSNAPPGAIDLPNVFDKAMKLNPTSPSKGTYNNYNHPMFTAPKPPGEDFNESVIRQPPSPTRKANKENTPPNSTRLGKDLGPNPAAAAISRQEAYKTRDGDSIQRRQVQMRGLTPEEMEKLQNPRVKRLVNVTQLCRFRAALFQAHALTF